MVDATDLKSVDCKVVWVQVPLPPLNKNKKDTMTLRVIVSFLFLPCIHNFLNSWFFDYVKFIH
jgi:hypothetical protein